MYALAIGISHVSDTLPEPVYAFLSGLNSATVGIIAVAAVNLSNKAINDHTSRIVVIGSGCAGLCYSALWYFPLLMVIGGAMTLLWDMLVAADFKLDALKFKRGNSPSSTHHGRDLEDQNTDEGSPLLTESPVIYATSTFTERHPRYGSDASQVTFVEQPVDPKGKKPAMPVEALPVSLRADSQCHVQTITLADKYQHSISVRWGLLIVAIFLLSFVLLMVLRGVIPNAPVEFKLFSNLFLAG